MKIDKVVLFACMFALAISASHQAISAIPTKQNSTVNKKAVAKKSAVATKTTATIKQTNKAAIKQNNTANAMTAAKLPEKTTPSSVLIDESKQKRIITPVSITSTKLADVAPKKTGAAFNGEVKFTLGEDKNIDPGKKNSDTFFEIAPSLKATSGGFSGSFATAIRDYSDADNSNLYKSTNTTASAAYKADFNTLISSITTLSGVYNDSRETSSLYGTFENGTDPGQQSRYAEVKIAETINLKVDSIKSNVGGFFTYRNGLSKETDDAPEPRGAREFERDYNEYGFNAGIVFAVAEYLDIGFTPSVSQIQHKGVTARSPIGEKFGQQSEVKEDLITSQLGTSIDIKFLGSKVSPNASIGQVSDQVYGARDRQFYTLGLKSELVLNKNMGLTISPSFNFKRSEYDNWTNSVKPGSSNTRVDYAATGGIDASIKLTKNFGVGLSYAIEDSKSNLPDPTINTRKEVVGTSVSLSF